MCCWSITPGRRCPSHSLFAFPFLFPLLYCQLLCWLLTTTGESVGFFLNRHCECSTLLSCIYTSTDEMKPDTKKAVQDEPKALEGFKKKHIKPKMITERLGRMWSSLPTAPYDYCQDHESAPSNVVGNAVIPTCNAGHLLFMQPGIWKTYCISKDGQEWIIFTKIAIKLC